MLQRRTRPEVDESLIGVEMEQLWEYIEPDGNLILRYVHNRLTCGDYVLNYVLK